jgi:hypothetical protein
MKLLGPTWEDLDRQGLILTSEVTAAKALLREVGGVSLLVALLLAYDLIL